MSDVPPPPPPGTQPSTPPPPPVPSVGAVGKPRSIVFVIVLSIVAFGIWTVVWSYQNGAEPKRHSSTGISGIGYLFITFLISPATMFLTANEVEQPYRNEGCEPRIITRGPVVPAAPDRQHHLVRAHPAGDHRAVAHPRRDGIVRALGRTEGREQLLRGVFRADLRPSLDHLARRPDQER